MATRRCRSRRASSGRCSRVLLLHANRTSPATGSSTRSGARTCRTRRRRWCRSTSRSCARRFPSRGCTPARRATCSRSATTSSTCTGSSAPSRTRAQALAQGEPGAAGELLGEALALWRGPALAEFSEPFAQHEGARLEELRLAALEWRIEADLALGRHRDVVGELEALIAEHPLRERLRSQLMLALYRSGRHAEALASYQAFRRTLADELGIEPSASLRELERRMLRQDADARAAAARAAPRQPRRQPTRRARRVGDVAYARSGDVRIAYQVVGDGPVDLVLVHGWVCTFQPGWENPKLAAFYRRLASMGRLILFDKRGTGLSDRVSPERLPDLETRMDDVRAVMDAVGSERAVVLGISEGGADVGAVRRDASRADARRSS